MIKEFKSAFINCSIFFWMLPLLCFSQEITPNEEISKKIDSLIEIHPITENCMLINFGTDAITAIKTIKGVVVIDAGISSGLTARYGKIIEQKWHNTDFVYVINTHGHHDHYSGNTVFPKAHIVSHVNGLEKMANQSDYFTRKMQGMSKLVTEYDIQLQHQEADTEEWTETFTQKIRCLESYNDAKNKILARLPDITFSNSLKIDCGDISLEMFYFGNCHSSSDILIYVPELKALFIGDLFFSYGRPSIDEKLAKDKTRWAQSVSWTEKRMHNIEHIIGGHGQMLTLDDLESFNQNMLERCSEE
jgi:glyoxylase-like metal-dependent hydrolase (beta-lactamase superfamily II)